MVWKLMAAMSVLLLSDVTGSITGVSGSSFTSQSRYLDFLREHLSQMRHPGAGKAEWLEVRDFVRKELEAQTRRVQRAEIVQQSFRTSIMVDDSNSIEVPGENIIAVFRGRHWNTSRDRILVIGAHYDSDAFTDGINDNGSGVVALLELSRRLANMLEVGTNTAKYTTIFVALDLQTTEYIWYEHSKTGCDVFVNNYLGPQLLHGSPERLLGALILDSILNYNASKNSQALPQGFNETFPNADQEIRLHKYRGDFLALVVRNQTADEELFQEVKQAWSEATNDNKFRLLPLQISRNKSATEAFFYFLKQGQLSFWNYNPREEKQIQLPAALLTDTGTLRGAPSDDHLLPAVDNFVTPEKLEFLEHTIETVVRMIQKNIDSGVQPLGRNDSLRFFTVVCLSLLITRICH